MTAPPSPSVRSEPLFPTPLMIEAVPDHEVGRPAIAAALIAAAAVVDRPADLGWSAQGQGGWSAGLALLERRAGALASRMTVDTRGPRQAVAWRIRTAVHVAGQGQHLDLPPSYDAFWSALYIAENGHGGPSRPDGGGELVFHDPRLPMTMMEMPDLRLRPDPVRTGEVYAPDIVVRPATGTLLLFPGWLRLSCRPLRSRGPRVMVAMALIAPLG